MKREFDAGAETVVEGRDQSEKAEERNMRREHAVCVPFHDRKRGGGTRASQTNGIDCER